MDAATAGLIGAGIGSSALIVNEGVRVVHDWASRRAAQKARNRELIVDAARRWLYYVESETHEPDGHVGPYVDMVLMMPFDLAELAQEFAQRNWDLERRRNEPGNDERLDKMIAAQKAFIQRFRKITKFDVL